MPPDTTRYTSILAAPFGALGIATRDGTLCRIDFLPPGTPPRPSADTLTAQIASQLTIYFQNPRHRFTLALPPVGTTFQRRVWAAIAAIPCGQTRSYGDIATELDTAARAVGQACGANPTPLLIPCHRIVGATKLGGFANAHDGYLMEAKRWLLAHETP